MKLSWKAVYKKVSHSTLQQGGFGCELHCSRFRAFATIWPRWPEAGPQVRWQIHPIMVFCSSQVYSFVQLYFLPLLSSAMPLPTTICSPVLGDSYLLPISNALVRAQYRNGGKKQFFRDFLSVPTLIKQHKLSLSYSSWGTIWRTRHCAQQCNEHLHAEDTSLEASRAVDIPDIPFDHMITTFCSEEVHFSSLLTTCSTKLDITALPLNYIAKIKWLLKEAVKRN